ncbi:MAG: transcriptional regulator [Bacteroidia bacterium]|nr:transcriptional regulator [Bacteroidia bacterium]
MLKIKSAFQSYNFKKSGIFEVVNIAEAKNQFITTWGNFGQQWGINKPMGQIHALLLISSEPLCTLQIMDKLQISSGNANTNVRALVNLGLLYKVRVLKDRKEYFKAEKDIEIISKILNNERKKREFDPLIISLLKIDKNISNTPQTKEFKKIVKKISSFVSKTDRNMNKIFENIS